MGSFYGSKIRNKVINPKTGEAWKLENVPSLWKKKTEEWLNQN